jgi:type II secretory pathway pseudopilin PulG
MTALATKRISCVCDRTRRAEQGYILLTLLLFVSLLVIAAAAAAPHIAFEIKREREEELVHRGAEYTRAIQRFAKANARYPLRLEELQSTGGVKYIRKLYKDPVTGGDFRLLYMSDIRVATGTAVQGDPGFQGNAQGSPAGSGSAALTRAAAPAPAFAPAPAENQNGDATSAGSPAPAAATQPSPSSASPSANNNQPSGRGAIIGVASKSTARSIREFDRKNHYNDWLFFYDPTYYRSQRINGPTSLTLPTATALNGATGQNQSQAGQNAGQPAGQN